MGSFVPVCCRQKIFAFWGAGRAGCPARLENPGRTPHALGMALRASAFPVPGRELSDLFRKVVECGASDLHADESGGLWLRIHGELQPAPHAPTTALLSPWVTEALDAEPGHGDADFSFAIEGCARFRVHLYRMNRLWGLVIRVIQQEPPSLSKMGLPRLLERIPHLHRGLVLVTGATGSGKSSTLAAILDAINESSHRHIVTIEDPIEFVHRSKLSRLSQREVGTDCPSFAGALRSALREDPDVILVGEMRDPETVSVALKAAETGHLVLSTVHTQDAVRTIGRLIALFPPEEQRLVRLRLADSLAGIVSQRLVPKVGGGRCAAMEIVMVTQTVRDCLETPERTDEIVEHVQTSGDGQSFDRHLVELYLEGTITIETAREHATRPSDLERELRFGKLSGGQMPAELEAKVELAGPRPKAGR